MKYKNLFWGILLITIAVLWFLEMINVITISFSSMFLLWPFVLVWIGISILPIKDVCKIILDLLVLALAVFIVVMPEKIQNISSLSSEEIKTKVLFTKEVDSISINQTIDLSMSLSGGQFIINSGDDLVSIVGVDKKNHKVSIRHEKDEEDLHSEIELNCYALPFSYGEQDYEILLHSSPIWSINVDAGAAKCLFDLSNFKVRKIEANAGVTEFYIKIGTLYSDVEVKLATGVAATKIEVPLSMQCIVHDESGMTHLNLKDFNKQDDKYIAAHQSDTLKGVVNIYVQSGLSNIDIVRY